MDGNPLRRRIQLTVPVRADALTAALDERLRATPSLEGRVRRQAVLIWLAAPARRWWSPCLDLSVRDDEGGARLEGYACAHPHLMTGMVFAGIFLTFLAAFSAVWSTVQWTMDEPPRCLFGTAAALTGLGAIALVHRVGSRYADAQIDELTGWLHAAVR
jgi:hypothetical protein